jgi:hypothetical protein
MQFARTLGPRTIITLAAVGAFAVAVLLTKDAKDKPSDSKDKPPGDK